MSNWLKEYMNLLEIGHAAYTLEQNYTGQQDICCILVCIVCVMCIC